MNKPNDPHKERAAAIFGVPVEQVTPVQRKYAKTVYFFDMYSTPFPRPIGKVVVRGPRK